MLKTFWVNLMFVESNASEVAAAAMLGLRLFTTQFAVR